MVGVGLVTESGILVRGDKRIQVPHGELPASSSNLVRDRSAMGGEDQDPFLTEVPLEPGQEPPPAFGIEMREQRSTPDQVVIAREPQVARVFSRVSRDGPESLDAEVDRRSIDVTRSQIGVGKRRLQHPEDPAVAARKVKDVPRLIGSGNIKGKPDVRKRGQANTVVPLGRDIFLHPVLR